MRRTSEAGERFPWTDPTVCFIEQDRESGAIRPVGTSSLDREAMTKRANGGVSQVYVVWPGKRRSDLFEVDDLEPLKRIHGIEEIHEAEVLIPDQPEDTVPCYRPGPRGVACSLPQGHDDVHSWGRS